MEVLHISANGQWSLEKSSDVDNFKSYKVSTQGQLPEDFGTKGMLHNTSNTRPDKQTSKERMRGQTPTPMRSADDVRNPGSPGQQGDRTKKK